MRDKRRRSGWLRSGVIVIAAVLVVIGVSCIYVKSVERKLGSTWRRLESRALL